MSKRLLLVAIPVLVLALAAVAWRADALNWLVSHFMISQADPPSLPANFSQITIPFELVNEHISIKAQVNDSRALEFMLDTGDKFAIVDLDLAKELGVKLGGDIDAHGMGTQVTKGAFVKGASFRLSGFTGFSQPVTLAFPMRNLAPRLGHDLDGVIGSEFIKYFVLELDYQKRTITLHNRDTFSYSGSGESVPIHLSSMGHPVLQAAVTPVGGDPIDADFVLDVGASGALQLNSTFVADHHLPGPNVQTIREIGTVGAGGETQGRIGHVAAFRIGKYTLRNPATVFSSDKSGAAAASDVQGNIGEEILERFKLFFDYSHDRIIFEPNAAFADGFDRAFSGLHIEAEGKDYKIFRIKEVLENAPGSEAGLQRNDVITAVDGRPASDLNYSAVLEMFRRPATLKLTIERAGQTLSITLTPRKLI
jgi:hypothetical protein